MQQEKSIKVNIGITVTHVGWLMIKAFAFFVQKFAMPLMIYHMLSTAISFVTVELKKKNHALHWLTR